MAEKVKQNPKANGWLDDPDRKAKSEKAMDDFGAGAAEAKGRIVLPALQIQPFHAYIVGDSELIVHAWSEKAKKEMLDKQTGEPTAGKEKKDPQRDFLGSLYTFKPGKPVGDWRRKGPDGHPAVHIEGGVYVFPAIGLKNAMVEACTSLGKSITKVAARQAFQVVGEMFRVLGRPRMREDMVRLSGMGNPADIRFRGAFPPPWAMKVSVRYNARVLSASQVANLLNTAGFAVGIGEWRSERDGSFGQFHVASAEEVKAVEKQFGKDAGNF